MAATYKPIDVFDYVKYLVKNMPLETIQTRLMDDVSKIMWNYAPWRWTIGTFSPITVTATTRDFNVVSPPTDFLYLTKAYLSNGQQNLDLKPVAALPATPTIKGTPNYITYLPAGPQVRIYPPFGSLPAGETWNLQVYYKKQSPVLTKATLSTAGVLLFDDEYFWVYQEGVLYRAYFYADDPRAGTATVNSKGDIQYSGQLGIFMAALAEMRRMEPLVDLSTLGEK